MMLDTISYAAVTLAAPLWVTVFVLWVKDRHEARG